MIVAPDECRHPEPGLVAVEAPQPRPLAEPIEDFLDGGVIATSKRPDDELRPALCPHDARVHTHVTAGRGRIFPRNGCADPETRSEGTL